MKLHAYYFILYPLLFLFFGCSSGNLILIEPIQKGLTVSSISCSESRSTVSVPFNVQLSFLSKLKECLYANEGFREGLEMTLQYRFLQYKEPRMFDSENLGGITQSGPSLAVEATFLDPQKTTITIIRVECRGNKAENAAERAAYLIAKFAAINFLKATK